MCFIKSKKLDKNLEKTESLIYHIRNALAHCHFAIYPVGNDQMLVLEVAYVGAKTIDANAEMLIRTSTLMRWIEIIEAGENSFPEYNTQKQTQIPGLFLNEIRLDFPTPTGKLIDSAFCTR